MPEQYDLLIRGGTVIDGTGGPRRLADVGLHGDRIGKVGPIPEDALASTVSPASGLVVAPGFIDVHAHDDTLALIEPDNEGKVMQGVTTVINGNCGSGVVPFDVIADGIARRVEDISKFPRWESYGEYLELFVERPASHNVATLVGQGTMRAGALRGATERRPATEEEMARMRNWLRDALEMGAVGLSTGLIYEPGRYTSTDEIAALAAECADFDAIYASHIRGEGATLLDAVREAIEIGERAGVPVQISHHKASGRAHWGKVNDSLRLIEEARARGADVTADQYPYTASSTRLYAIWQNGAFEGPAAQTGENVLIASAQKHPEWEGKRLSDLEGEWDLPLDQVVRRILDSEEGHGVLIVQFAMSEDDVRTVLRHATTMVGTDGLGWGSKPHPRHYGTYPRILGRYVREEGLLSLEEAVHKMSGMPAQKFRLAGRGVLREGAIADLVLFDPDIVAELATYEDPRRPPAGIPWVLVNGEPVVREGRHTHARPGRPVRRGVDV
jgi:N-acyl-D-amino-acid deacylase